LSGFLCGATVPVKDFPYLYFELFPEELLFVSRTQEDKDISRDDGHRQGGMEEIFGAILSF